MKIELKPCPFCGSTNLSVEATGYDLDYASIYCADCEAEGPKAMVHKHTEHLISEVKNAWNRRYNED